MEATLVKQYPEAPLIVAMAESTWAGSRKTAKIEFSLSDNLRTKLKELLGKEVHKIFITDSDARHIKRHHGQNEERKSPIGCLMFDRYRRHPPPQTERPKRPQPASISIAPITLVVNRKILPDSNKTRLY